jgi:hypothetical protein
VNDLEYLTVGYVGWNGLYPASLELDVENSEFPELEMNFSQTVYDEQMLPCEKDPNKFVSAALQPILLLRNFF